MKPVTRFTLGIVLCILIAALAICGDAAMMASMYAFRSPLANDPPPPGDKVGAPITRRVVAVLIDALRDDTARRQDVMPFLNELRGQGAWATMHARAPSFSQTGNTVLFTGGWQELSDAPLLNLDGDQRRVWSQDNLFSAAHRARLKTAVAADLSFRGQIPPETLDVKFFTGTDGAPGAIEVMRAAIPLLQDPSYALVLIHFDQVDYAGHHLGGAASQAWNDAAHQVDAYLRQIASGLDLSQDTLAIFSDHGQRDQGGHGGPEAIVLLEPFVLAGRGVKPGEYPGVQMVDVAPTVAALLGTNIPASSEGKVLTGMLALGPEHAVAISGALSAQQAGLATAYSRAMDRPLRLIPAELSVSKAQADFHDAQAPRLSVVRLPRLGLALVIAVLPAIVLHRHRGGALAWLFGGALVYFILFNLLFLLVFRRTYSLGTVDSAGCLLGTAALINFQAFGLAWLMVSFGLGTFRSSPFEAAEKALALTLLTLYLLALIMLVTFVLNGITLTWAMPELHSMFVGFFAMLQSLFVSAMGLVLVSVSAPVTFARGRPLAEGIHYEYRTLD